MDPYSCRACPSHSFESIKDLEYDSIGLLGNRSVNILQRSSYLNANQHIATYKNILKREGSMLFIQSIIYFSKNCCSRVLQISSSFIEILSKYTILDMQKKKNVKMLIERKFVLSLFSRKHIEALKYFRVSKFFSRERNLHLQLR